MDMFLWRLLMAEEIPTGDVAVYVFFYSLFFCLMLAGIDSLVVGKWKLGTGLLFAASVFFVTGVKWRKLKTSATAYLARQPVGERIKPEFRS